MMTPCARPASLTRASAPLSTRNWSTWRETSARVNCPSGSFGCSGKRNGRGFLASKRDFHSSSGRRIGGGFMSSATSTCFPTNTIAPRTLSFTEFKYVSSSGCVGCFGSAGFASAGIGGAAPGKLNPPPVGGANPGGTTITTCAVTIPFVLGVHANGFTISCPRKGVTASAKSSLFSQPGTGVAALGGWKAQGSRCAFANPHDVMVLTAQSSAAFKFGVPVTRGPNTSATSWMIHIILELFVSSARICAYISESAGACAGSGIAASSKKHNTHAHSFATVPPRILRKFSARIASRWTIYARDSPEATQARKSTLLDLLVFRQCLVN